MPQTDLGPVNIVQGNTAEFIAEFFDSNNATSVPVGASIIVDYTTITNVSTSTTVSMTLTNSFFIGTWSTANATLGVATWNLYATGESTAAQTGLIRVIAPTP